jgi:hypothetical protein
MKMSEREKFIKYYECEDFLMDELTEYFNVDGEFNQFGMRGKYKKIDVFDNGVGYDIYEIDKLRLEKEERVYDFINDRDRLLNHIKCNIDSYIRTIYIIKAKYILTS